MQKHKYVYWIFRAKSAHKADGLGNKRLYSYIFFVDGLPVTTMHSIQVRLDLYKAEIT